VESPAKQVDITSLNPAAAAKIAMGVMINEFHFVPDPSGGEAGTTSDFFSAHIQTRPEIHSNYHELEIDFEWKAPGRTEYTFGGGLDDEQGFYVAQQVRAALHRAETQPATQ
jgi:hypothetical protein